MSVNINKEDGTIIIADEVLATIAGVAATECYGVVGMASNKLKDGIAELLKKENYSKGILIRSKNELLEVDLHVVLAYGVKISEVCHAIQAKVKYNLENTLSTKVDTVNIFVQGVKVIEESK